MEEQKIDAVIRKSDLTGEKVSTREEQLEHIVISAELPEHHVKDIKEGLLIPTYQLTITDEVRSTVAETRSR